MAKAKPKARAKVRRYDEGGDVPDDVKAANETDDPIYALGKSRGWFKEDDGGDTAPAKTQSFGQAFKVARANYLAGTGDKNFTWNGKSYSTDVAGSKSPAPASRAKASAASDDSTPSVAAPQSRGDKLKADFASMNTPEERQKYIDAISPGGTGAALKGLAGLASKFGSRAAPALNEYVMPLLGGGTQRAIANNATRAITGPTKAELMAAQRATRASGRYEDMLNQNAQAAGVSPGSPAAQYLASKMKQLGMKKGGVVKMAKGGSVSSASKRADGIARKGLTKGRMR